jgi:prepilin-type N-terminal cleavage/methylation domain-containing protein
MNARGGSGFTLVEVLVALIVTALVALIAHGIFGAALDSARELRTARGSLDREVNSGRLLASAFLSLDVGEDAGPFEGRSDRVEFTSWLPTPDGWWERSRVRLRADGGKLLYEAGSAPAIELSDSVVDLHVDYLLEPGAAARWVGNWTSAVSAPLAVRLRLLRVPQTGRQVSDTVLFLIGGRG